MKNDVLAWASGQPTSKRAAKETLNHAGLIELVSGLNVYTHTAEAYRRAYEALGIDVINRVPLENAPEPTPANETRLHPTRPYRYAPLGVYDTVMRHTYECASPEDVWRLDVAGLRYDDLLTPAPHTCHAEDTRAREAAIGEVGLYYPMLCTTLFMWAVEGLGWQVFMLAAASEPKRFFECFLQPCIAKSRALVTEMARASDSPFVFVHDDLATATGPVFRPRWYDQYIFPHYGEIWGEAKRLGKKVIYVADGNMTAFLQKLVEAGVDGLLFESPATPLDAVLEHFGAAGRFFIGGISTRTLTFGTADEIRRMVYDLSERAGACPGFAMASGGGLHNNIPLANLEAYLEARVEVGATPMDWRTRCRAG